jgi:hypothetical protein
LFLQVPPTEARQLHRRAAAATTRFSETAMFRFAQKSPIFENLRYASQRHRIVQLAEDR